MATGLRSSPVLQRIQAADARSFAPVTFSTGSGNRLLAFLLALFAATAAMHARADSRFCISNDTFTFGDRAVGTSSTANFTVTNCGDQSWSFTDVSVDPATGSAFQVSTSCKTGAQLAPSATCSVTVLFAPLVPGQTSGGLWLRNTSTDPDELLTFYGRGVDAQAGTASLSFEPATAAFGEQVVGGPATSLTITMRNAGPAALTPTAMVFNGPAAYDFSGYDGGCNKGTPIAAGQSCLLVFYFQPQALGLRLANFIIDSPQLASLAILQLSGTGVTTPPPPPTITPQVGIWWNPAESGSGYALDYRHGVLVVTIFAYTADGAAQWYLASGSLSGTTFTATLNKYAGGECIACAYTGSPMLDGNDGVITIVFSSDTSATMYLPGGRVTQIQPQAF